MDLYVATKSLSIVNGYAGYMIRRVPRITIDN